MLIVSNELFCTKLEINQHSKINYPVQNDGNYVLQRKEHNISTYIQHWQQRDLVKCPDNNTIIRSKRNAIFMYNTKTKTDQCLHGNLPFTPVSIHSRHGYLALGGQTGLLMIIEIASGNFKIISNGRGMNGSVFLSYLFQNKTLTLTVCNNDQTVSVFSVPNLERLQTFTMPSVINHSSMSPDGEKILMVSELGTAYIYTVTKEGAYSEPKEFQVSGEPALSCAWNQTSDIFAITSQDGSVSVYDFKAKQKLCKLCSIETRKTKKTPRSIQFSTRSMDLLAYADHVSNVYIVDTRTFETRQIIRLSPENEDHPITGLAFSPNCKSLFVGLQDRLIELEIDVPSRRWFPSNVLA